MMRHLELILGVAMVVACSGAGDESADDVADLPEPGPLAPVTDGCPDLSTPGEKTFLSNGVERKFAIYFPESRPADMPLIFTWHGLTTTSDSGPSIYDPIPAMTAGFDLDGLAEDKEAVVIVAEAQPIALAGMNVLLWGILNNEDNDLALFDDLRTCVAEEFSIDLRRVTSWGFSGGALWSSLLMMERSDVLAAGVAASGGVDLVIPLLGDALSYRTPAERIPVFLTSGGETDAWPDPSLPIIQFEEATNHFEAGLLEDGHFVVRCRHDEGHWIPSNLWKPITRWLLNHTFGAPSPYETGDKSVDSACEVAG